MNGAIAETNRSADLVRDASSKVSGAAECLAPEVRAFFIKLRSGPLNRRERSDPGFAGPERRTRRKMDTVQEAA